MTTLQNKSIASFKGIMYSLMLIIFLNTCGSAAAQTEKGTNAILLHNFSPTGIKIDGLPMTLFPQNSGLGFTYGSHKVKSEGNMLDTRENVLTFGLSLSGHYFLFDNFSLGLSGSYYSGTTTYTESEMPDEKYATTMMMGGPELRYYFHGGHHVKYWLKASPALGLIKSTYDDMPVHVPKRLYQFSGGGGISYFPSKSFSVDLGVTYNIFTIRNKGNYTENSRKEYIDSVGLDIGFSFFF